MAIEHVHLEHDGKLLLVDQNGDGPMKPVTVLPMRLMFVSMSPKTTMASKI